MNKGYSYRSTVDPAGVGNTVVAFLAERFRHLLLEEWQARIERGEVEVGGRRAGAGDVLRAGEVVVWHRPPWPEPEVPRAFTVLYEDDAVVAVSKPSGLPTMPAGGFLEHSLLHLVQERFGRVRPLHRLGRFTSGVVLFARTARAASALALTWRAQAVQKDYRALAAGAPPWDALEVRQPIGPVPSAAGKRPCGASRRPRRRQPARRGRAPRRRGAARRPHHHRPASPVSASTARGPGIRWSAIRSTPPAAACSAPPGLPGDGGYLLHAWRLQRAHPGGLGTLPSRRGAGGTGTCDVTAYGRRKPRRPPNGRFARFSR